MNETMNDRKVYIMNEFISNRLGKVGTLYFGICMSIFLFIVDKGAVMNEYIDIPHIEMRLLPIYIVLLITIIFFCWMFKYIKFDLICLLLLIRLVVHFIPLFYGSSSTDFPVNFVTSCLCFTTYIIALNFTEDDTFVYKVIKLLFLIICAQVIIEAFMGEVSFFGDTYLYKHDMTIPIGNSNAIASKVIALFAFLMCVEEEKRSKIVYLVLLIITVALTKSRGGIVTALASIGLVFIWKGKVSVKSIMKLILLMLVIGIGFYLFKEFTSIGEYVFSGSTSTVSGRVVLWEEGLALFLKHPLFGNGFSDPVVNNHPHNFIIDILMRSGIFGILLMIGIIISFIYKVRNYTTNNYVRGCICFAFCLLAQGLVEIVLFGYIHDMMLWFILGSMCCMVNQLDRADVE